MSNLTEKSSSSVEHSDHGDKKHVEIVDMEGDKQQMYPTFHSDKSKDSLFESLRVPNNYESTHHAHHHHLESHFLRSLRCILLHLLSHIAHHC